MRVAKAGLLFASLCMLTAASAGAFAGRLPAAGQDQYIVGFHGPTGLAPGGTFEGAAVLSVTDGEGLHFALVQPEDFKAWQAKARAHAAVRYIEFNDPSYAVTDLVPNDPGYGNTGHYGSKKIGAETAWDRTLGSTAVKVAHIDSGLNKNHEEFSGSGRVLQGFDFANNDGDPNDEGGACVYHGTHTAGTAGATINNNKGLAGLSQHTVLPIKSLKPSLIISIPLITTCSGGQVWLANGLKYAADQGAHLSSNSWSGGGASPTLNDAIAYAFERGVTMVASAGNGGPCSNCVGQPWLDNPDKAIIVSCTTSTDSFCSFSSEGPQVDVAAPGDSIYSSCGGTTSYCTYSGTSMSAPHVTGTLALIKALNPSFGYAQLDNRIKSTAVDLGPAGDDDEFGYGRISASASVT